jgi:effector-binding domain-containing protein
MPPTVELVDAPPRIVAAVRRRVPVKDIPAAFKPALDEVWSFLGKNPGLRTDGHNIFLYHHASGHPATGMDIDFGVEVTRRFRAEGQVMCVDAPGGRAAQAVHRGPYRELAATHDALHDWISRRGEKVGSWSCEIYGDWSDDESKLETTVVYALA